MIIFRHWQTGEAAKKSAEEIFRDIENGLNNKRHEGGTHGPILSPNLLNHKINVEKIEKRNGWRIKNARLMRVKYYTSQLLMGTKSREKWPPIKHHRILKYFAISPLMISR